MSPVRNAIESCLSMESLKSQLRGTNMLVIDPLYGNYMYYNLWSFEFIDSQRKFSYGII